MQYDKLSVVNVDKISLMLLYFDLRLWNNILEKIESNAAFGKFFCVVLSVESSTQGIGDKNVQETNDQ